MSLKLCQITILTLYILTSAAIFSPLFSVHFFGYWQREFTQQSKHLRLVIITFILMVLMNYSAILNHCKEKWVPDNFD